jgi:hypothetical protein
MDRRTIRCALCREGHLSAAWEVFRVQRHQPSELHTSEGRRATASNA